MTKKIRVDVLYDSLATESRVFTWGIVARIFALEMLERDDVTEVQIDGKRVEPWNAGKDTT